MEKKLFKFEKEKEKDFFFQIDGISIFKNLENSLISFSDFKNKKHNQKFEKVKCYFKNNKRIINIAEIIHNKELIPNEALYTFSYFELSNDILILAIPCKSSIFMQKLILKFEDNDEEVDFSHDQQVELHFEKLEGNYTSEDKLYCSDFGVNDTEGIILAVGGEKGIIYIIPIEECFTDSDKTIRNLYSNCNSLNCLKFAENISENCLLASYQDSSIILWNALKEVQVILFKRLKSPSPDCLSLDFHWKGNLIVAGYADACVAIWEISQKIKEKIKEIDKTNDKNCLKMFKRELCVIPKFCNGAPHENYIDCLFFYGDKILSKDAQKNLSFWIPLFEENSALVLQYFELPFQDNIWFSKFAINIKFGVVAFGNDSGEVFFFKIWDNSKQFCFKDFRKNPEFKMKLKNDNSLIRQIEISEDFEFLLCISDSGKIWVKKLPRKSIFEILDLKYD